MKTLKLHEIIEINDKGTDSILTELLYLYRKSLLAYYRNYFTSEPVLMVTDVFNAAQYALIVPCDELNEAMTTYLGDDDYIFDNDLRELISSQSIMLNQF